jgi:hypothetical protein
VDHSTQGHESETCSSSPEISLIAFQAQLPNLRFASLIDVGFAIIAPLARHSGLRFGSCTLARAFAPRFFRPRLAATPLRFAITSPLSGCEEDFHLQAIKHVRRTKKQGGLSSTRPVFKHESAKLGRYCSGAAVLSQVADPEFR